MDEKKNTQIQIQFGLPILAKYESVGFVLFQAGQTAALKHNRAPS